MLCAYYMNGYECKQDKDIAFSMLQQAATDEHHSSRAFMYRIWQACRLNDANSGLAYLETYAKAGPGPALADLKTSFPKDKAEGIERWIIDASGGVGADWLRASEMLDGYTQSEWIKDEWLMEKVHRCQKPLSQLIVNKRGDTVLRFAAMCGRWKPFKSWILDYGMDINLQNPLGRHRCSPLLGPEMVVLSFSVCRSLTPMHLCSSE